VCFQEFKSVEKQSYTKRIYLFTSSDEVNAGEKEGICKRAKDLQSIGAEIELFPLPLPNAKKAEFDTKKFFKEIVNEGGDLVDLEAQAGRMQDLLKRIKQKEFRKRTQGKCLFQLSP